MNLKEISDLRSQVEPLCSQVGSFIASQLDKVNADDIISKDMNSLVSFVDQQAEEKLVSSLSRLTPNAGFITEENTVLQEQKELTWVIDPLDGTTNFLYKIPHFSISVALMKGEELIYGTIHEIMLNKAYSAIKGHGAWEGGKPIRVNKQSNKAVALVSTGFPYQRDDRVEERMQVFKKCITDYRGIRRLGSAALDLAYVASGKYDLFYENTLNIWDIAAGVLLVEEAGGKVFDFNGDKNYLNNGGVIAGNPLLIDDLLQDVRKSLA
jgi:myo-inositol-1(or 4)-monophosphatase